MKHFLYLFLLLPFVSVAQFVPCDDSQEFLIIEILTDNWPNENFLSVEANGVVIFDAPAGYYTDANSTIADTICVPAGACITFQLGDTYGDGIGNGTGQGNAPEADRVRLYQASGLIYSSPVYNQSTYYQFNCPPGTICETAIPAAVGDYTAPLPNTWYIFEPTESGNYEISTCAATCDTKLWVYGTCDLAAVSENQAGSLAYNDDSPTCGYQSVINMNMQAGTTYYIRVGDYEVACEGMSIDWSLVYLGPTAGCTDPTACNFDPLATVDDGSCIPIGDPACPGPDLLMVQEALINSLAVGIENSQDGCLVSEGCLNGFGIREVVRFDTHIKNIGAADYYIGQPVAGSGQFTFDNCHNHYHYEGYAQYLLYDMAGNLIPIGFKNGFCVLDLECSGGGTAQYGCDNMGISVGCGDIYGAYLDCQWVDVTDIADGSYILVTRVNWDGSPDALGHYEATLDNNWAQACITLDRSSGELAMVVNPDCEPYTDCTGQLYGNAVIDCNGVCGGSSVRGDLDVNNVQEMADAVMYVTGILGDDLAATPCNDLNADGEMTVYDASLLASCLNNGQAHPHPGQGIHNHCNFPAGIENPNDSAWISIVAIDPIEKYIDIAMRNPTDDVNAFQFEVSGITLQAVTPLTNPVSYPSSIQGSISTNTVIGISYQDSVIYKSSVAMPLVRIHYSAATSNDICISNVVDIVNGGQQRIWTGIENGCVQLVGTNNIAATYSASVQPNPFSTATTLVYSNPQNELLTLTITDMSGKKLRTYNNLRGEALNIEADGLPAGMYYYHLSGKLGNTSGKLVIE